MNLLAIDTSSEQLGVALVNEQRVLASYVLLGARPHGVELPQAISRVLQEAGQTLEQSDSKRLSRGRYPTLGREFSLAAQRSRQRMAS